MEKRDPPITIEPPLAYPGPVAPARTLVGVLPLGGTFGRWGESVLLAVGFLLMALPLPGASAPLGQSVQGDVTISVAEDQEVRKHAALTDCQEGQRHTKETI